MQHSLQQAYPELDIAIRAPLENTGERARTTLAIAIGDSLLPWLGSAKNPYASTLAFYVGSAKFAAIEHSDKVSALYRDQPLLRQLRLAKLLLPDLQRAAVIYGGEGPPHNLAALQRRSGVTVDAVDIDHKPDWAKALSQLMIENDILLGVDDPEIYNRDTIRSILLTTYRRGKILIGPNRPFVTAGSLASTYTSSEQFLQQLNSMVGEYLQQGRLPPAQYPRFYRIAVNEQVAASLGLNIPDEKTLYEHLQKRLGECGDDC
jgi:ABC-type uncharacterized transport system substrate-binding protein